MSHTIRIKIPPKSSEEPSPQTQSPEPNLSRRKSIAPKRRVVNSDDEDYDDKNEGVGMREVGIEAQRPAAKRARRSYSATDSMDVDGDGEMEMDAPEASSAPTAMKVKPTKKAVAGKKRRAAVFSSDDDDDFVDAATQAGNRGRQGSSPLPSLGLGDGDYDYGLPAARSKPVRQKNPTWKVRDGGTPAGSGNGNGNSNGNGAKAAKGVKVGGGGGGVAGGSKTGKGKAVKKESKEILIKDKRKRTDTPPVKRETSIPKLQAGAQSKESQSQSRSPLQVKKEVKEAKEEINAQDVTLDIINDPAPPSSPKSPPPKKEAPPLPANPPAPAPTTIPTPVPPKKTKLPPIRKNKPPGAATGTGTGTGAPTSTQTQGKQPPATSSAAAAAAAAVPSDKSGTSASAAGAAGARKTADFDLRDKSAWASIFKQTGGSTPRSGLSRREKEEERRKELYKMRDEARAKREESLKHTFDLQASWDKISRFEERLRTNRSSALYPNLFAAKFRDEWAVQKRERERERERERGRQMVDGRVGEDVEMGDGRNRMDERGHRDERERRYP